MRSVLKNRILAQGQGGRAFQPTGILLYFEELEREPNKEIEPKDIFKNASRSIPAGSDMSWAADAPFSGLSQ